MQLSQDYSSCIRQTFTIINETSERPFKRYVSSKRVSPKTNSTIVLLEGFHFQIQGSWSNLLRMEQHE